MSVSEGVLSQGLQGQKWQHRLQLLLRSGLRDTRRDAVQHLGLEVCHVLERLRGQVLEAVLLGILSCLQGILDGIPALEYVLVQVGRACTVLVLHVTHVGSVDVRDTFVVAAVVLVFQLLHLLLLQLLRGLHVRLLGAGSTGHGLLLVHVLLLEELLEIIAGLLTGTDAGLRLVGGLKGKTSRPSGIVSSSPRISP